MRLLRFEIYLPTYISSFRSLYLLFFICQQATSEVPYTQLPCKVKKFFKTYQSKYNQSIPLEQTVPQFSLHVDGKLDQEVVINRSAVELLRNLIEQQIQLIHQRSHIHVNGQRGYRTYDSVEASKDGVLLRNNNGSANEEKGKIQLPESFTKVPAPP